MAAGCRHQGDDIGVQRIVYPDIRHHAPDIPQSIGRKHTADASQRVVRLACPDDADFLGGSRISHTQFDGKAVKLSLRQGVSSDVPGRVLRRNDHKWIRHRHGLSVYRDLSFLHRLQQCRLRFGRSAVDLVREQQVAHDQPFTQFKGFTLPIVNIEACDVRCHDVGRKLCPAEVQPCYGSECGGERSLAGAGHVLDQYMSACQQGGQEQDDLGTLSDHNLFHLIRCCQHLRVGFCHDGRHTELLLFRSFCRLSGRGLDLRV